MSDKSKEPSKEQLEVPGGAKGGNISPSIADKIKQFGNMMTGAATGNLFENPVSASTPGSKIEKTDETGEKQRTPGIERDHSVMTSTLITKSKQLHIKLRHLYEIVERFGANLFDPDTDKTQTDVSYEVVMKTLSEFQRLHESFLQQLLDDDLFEQYEKDEQLATTVSVMEFSVKKIYREFQDSQNPQTANATIPNHNVTGSTHQASEIHRRKHMKLELPKFDGDVRKWLAFKAAFKAVDDNPNYDNAEKFQYLLQSMVEGSAAYKTVNAYPGMGDDYSAAMEDLKKLYGNERTLIKVYVRDLLKLVVENARDKPNLSFMEMVNSLTSQIRSLELLGINPDRYGDLLSPVVESCISPVMFENYMRSLPSGAKEDLPSLLKFLNDEVQRKMQSNLARSPFADDKSKGVQQQTSKSGGNSGGKSTTTNFVNASGKDGKIVSCVFCEIEKGHASIDCRKAIDMSLEQRRDILAKAKACFKCFKQGHPRKTCRAQIKCIQCKGDHPTLVCNKGEPQQQKKQFCGGGEGNTDESRRSSQHGNPETTTDQVPASTNMSNFVHRPEVLLQTLVINVHGRNGTRQLKAMFDSGSQSSYILDHIARELSLPFRGKESTSHLTFGGQNSGEQIHSIYKMEISGLGQTERYNFDVSGIPTISGKIDSTPAGPWTEECKKRGIMLTDVSNSPLEIQVLIGSDVAGKLMAGLQSLELTSGPIAQQTKVGWVLQGKLPLKRKVNSSGALMCINMLCHSKSITDLWDLEAIGITDAATTDSRKELEEAAINHYNSTVSRDGCGRYEVHLPWIEAHPPLPNNRSAAVKRLESCTRTLIKDGHLKNYDDVFKQWTEEKIIEIVPVGSQSGTVNYLPHRAVYKEGSTTPLRPVFDASAKLKDSTSLNSCLEKGPNLLELIPAILTRFRMDKVGITADIKKAFLQMKVAEADRDSMRFLWWEDINDRRKLLEFRHCRVVFGVSSSPFLLGATLNHVLDSSTEYPATAARLKKSFYVDNCVTSLSSTAKANQFVRESQALLTPAQFDLRGWEFGPGGDKLIPLLGLLWDTKADNLQIDSSGLVVKTESTPTKRGLLSVANSIYDPLGFLAPFTLIVKLLLKRVWCDDRKFGWDDNLPDEIRQEYINWGAQLSSLGKVHIPRYVGAASGDKSNWEIHVFCDASKEAYAACVFLRVNEDPVKINLIQAKTRVSPADNKKKTVTIPRLELLSCLIGARLTKAVVDHMELPDIPINYWSDSTTALTWIQRDTVWAPFVYNRTREIRELTKISQWRHVPGEANPADLISRGCKFDKMMTMRWWEGPSWLYQTQHEWPSSISVPDEDEVGMEKRKTIVSNLSRRAETTIFDDLEKFGDFHTILRVLGYVIRFSSCLKSKWERRNASSNSTGQTHPPPQGIIPQLTQENIAEAEQQLIRHVQKSVSKHSSKRGIKYNTDEKGIVRVVTRLVSEEDSGFRFPAVLPGKHPIVKLLILKEHELAQHAGVQYMQGILREKYWILKSRRSIRNVIHKCAVCRRHDAKKCEVPQPPLPMTRTELSYAFKTTGVDMAGPLFVENGRKVWVALFTCAVYRAVHLELVTSLSTPAFIEAFTKFVARRGRPTTMYSDNGRNFTGAARLFRKINWEDVLRHAAIRNINWTFIAPSAAWWGGVVGTANWVNEEAD